MTPQSKKTNGSLKFIICIFLVISTLAVYWQVQDHEFVNYDDDVYITSNLNVVWKIVSQWRLETVNFSWINPFLILIREHHNP